MTETHGRVTAKGEKANGSRTSPVGVNRPGRARPCVNRPHHRAAGPPPSRRAPACQPRRPGRGDNTGESRVTTFAATVREAGHKSSLRQPPLVLALLTAVILLDQTAKWWAWRHVTGADINPGGDLLTGPTVGGWYAQPIPGALLDLLDFGLVSVAVAILARRGGPAAVTVCGALMVGGWGSNLVDRLGMHYCTAPGSIRGVVDFINIGGHHYNLADFFIVGATPLFLLAVACLAVRTASRLAATATPAAARDRPRIQAPIVALAAVGLITTVALGATYSGRLSRPSHTSVKCCQPAHLNDEIGGGDRSWYPTSGSRGRQRS